MTIVKWRNKNKISGKRVLQTLNTKKLEMRIETNDCWGLCPTPSVGVSQTLEEGEEWAFRSLDLAKKTCARIVAWSSYCGGAAWSLDPRTNTAADLGLKGGSQPGTLSPKLALCLGIRSRCRQLTQVKVLSSETNLKCIHKVHRAFREITSNTLSRDRMEENRTARLEPRWGCASSLPCQGKGPSLVANPFKIFPGVTCMSASVLLVEVTVTSQVLSTGPSVRKLTQDHRSSGTEI